MFFEYEGNSCFSVSMFDSSDSERESSHFAKNQCSVKQVMAPEVPQETLETDVLSTRKDGCSTRFLFDKPEKKYCHLKSLREQS